MAKTKLKLKPKPKNKAQSDITRQIYARLSAITAVVLLLVGGLALWGHIFISDMVRSELAAQKIYFPEKGSPALDPETYPDLQKYAGQLVDTPEEAEAYANGYIRRHLEQVAGGKVYSEVSTEQRKDPTNETLKTQKETLFQGETLRGILLTSGYAFGTIGVIADIAARAAFIGAALLGILAFSLRAKN